MPEEIKPKYTFIKNLSVLLIAVIFSISLLDIACRLFFKEQSHSYSPRIFIANNEVFPWCQPKKYSRQVHKKGAGSQFVMLMPNLTFAHDYPDNRRGYFDDNNRIWYRNNNYAFRGRDLVPEDTAKNKNRRQIILLGDSFTWGEGVYLKDTYPSILEFKLYSTFPHITSKVINFSQPGLNTYHEYIVWDIHKKLVAPDLVILAFTPNDFVLDKIKEQERLTIMGKYLKMFEKPVGMEAIFLKLKIYEFIKRRLQGKYLERKIEKITVDDLHKEINGPSPSNLLRIHLRQLYKAVQAEGSLFMVVIIPSFYKLEKDYPYILIHNLLAEIGKSDGFPVIDLLPVFKGKKSSQFWVHPIDHHPNEKAHKMIADYLFTHVDFKKTVKKIYGPIN